MDTSAPAALSPSLEGFSNSHVGIVGQLRSLEGLPALLAPARQARRIAEGMLDFFEEVVLDHHQQEEKVLFPAVTDSAAAGEERSRAEAMVRQLLAQHRRVEALWRQLEPSLARVARGRDAEVDTATLQQLVDEYLAHAAYEEESFLPLAQAILARDPNHMAALGLSLHLRHVAPVPGYV